MFLQQDTNILGTTRTVFISYPQNPVTAADAKAAIGIVSIALAQAIGEASAKGTYVALPSSTAVSETINGFNRTPIYSD